MATLTVNALSPSGGPEAALVPAGASGDQFANNGRCYLKITNGGASPVTVTITAQRTCDQGSVHSIANAVPAAATELMGPFTDRYTDSSGYCQVTYSAVTSVTVGVFALV